MTVPSFFDDSTPVLTPDLYLGSNRPVLPETFFLFFYDSPKMKELHKMNRPLKIANIPGFHFVVDGVGYKKMLMGSDMSVFMLELLIACGAKKFIIFGTACSIEENIKLNDLCVVETAICEESVTMHYVSYKREIAAVVNSNVILKQCMDEVSIPVKAVKTCTIPAIFRETEGKIKQWRSENVSVLDMEASALMTVANFRSVEISFLFFISDRIIDGKWECGNKLDFCSEGLLIERMIVEFK